MQVTKCHVVRYMYLISFNYVCVSSTAPAHLRYLRRCNGEAEVLSTAGRLEHPYPSLLQLPRVVDVLEAREAGKVDVQLHPLTETMNQLISLNGKGEGRQLYQSVVGGVLSSGWSNGWSIHKV